MILSYHGERLIEPDRFPISVEEIHGSAGEVFMNLCSQIHLEIKQQDWSLDHMLD